MRGDSSKGEEMIYGSQEYNKVFDDFRNGADYLNDVSVEIVGDVKDLSPLELLRYYEAEPTLDNNLAIATSFIMNKEVRFIKDNKIIHSFVYNGGDLGAKFVGCPWLIDVLLKTTYSILIKKLTPPSQGSDSGENR